MGYFIGNIITEIDEPNKVTLSGNPNYITLTSKQDTAITPKKVAISLRVIGDRYDISGFTIREKATKQPHYFKGTSKINEINNSTFFLGTPENTAENIRACFLKNEFLRANFEITLPPIPNPLGGFSRGDTIYITSRGFGDNYAFEIIPDEVDFNLFIEQTGDPMDTQSADMLNNGIHPSEIQIDILSDTGVFLGADDSPTSDKLGTISMTLTKAYANTPIWFDLNVLNRNKLSNEFLNANGWCDTGTMQDCRAIIRRLIRSNNVFVNEVFYISNVLYSITGYKRNLEVNNLSEYIYNTSDNNIVKPLTNGSNLFHIKGQTQFFNFILSDPNRNNDLGANEYNIGINYKLYTQSKVFIANVNKHNQNRKLFNIVNTIKLDIDSVIQGYDNVGVVEVYLSRNGVNVSTPITFKILPSCLYKVNDFAFLNSLGGWDTFNFGGIEQTDFKTDTNSIYKTQTPQHTISDEIESVFYKDVSEQFSAQTIPINETVCNWLKDLSSSIAVYKLSTKRYIVVDDLNIKPNSKDELFRLEMKYHYSDSYNSLIK